MSVQGHQKEKDYCVSSLLYAKEQPFTYPVRGASLAAENEELKQALKTVCNYVCSGQSLPTSSLQDAVTNESVHDMVAHIRTLKRQADDVDVTDFQDTLSRDGSPVRFPADTQPGNELHTPTVLPIQTQRSHLEEGMSYNDTENVMAVQEAYTMADQDSAQALELLERWYSGRNGYLGVWDTYR
jgi:hypothetical protein